jgi:chromosome segregation ATPase
MTTDNALELADLDMLEYDCKVTIERIEKELVWFKSEYPKLLEAYKALHAELEKLKYRVLCLHPGIDQENPSTEQALKLAREEIDKAMFSPPADITFYDGDEERKIVYMFADPEAGNAASGYVIHDTDETITDVRERVDELHAELERVKADSNRLAEALKKSDELILLASKTSCRCPRDGALANKIHRDGCEQPVLMQVLCEFEVVKDEALTQHEEVS